MSAIRQSMQLLLYLQANKVICHSPIDADRRPNASRSEALTAISVARILIHLHWFSESSFHRATEKG